MKKIVIPAILTATILIAGMFAFMPVQKASTVHTTILASTPRIFTVTDATGPADVEDAGPTATATAETLNVTADTLITSISMLVTGGDGTADTATVTIVTFDGGANTLAAASADVYTVAGTQRINLLPVVGAVANGDQLVVDGAGAGDLAITVSIDAGNAASAGGDVTSTFTISGLTMVTDTTTITLA